MKKIFLIRFLAKTLRVNKIVRKSFSWLKFCNKIMYVCASLWRIPFGNPWIVWWIFTGYVCDLWSIVVGVSLCVHCTLIHLQDVCRLYARMLLWRNCRSGSMSFCITLSYSQEYIAQSLWQKYDSLCYHQGLTYSRQKYNMCRLILHRLSM